MWLSILIGLANILPNPTPSTPRSAAPALEMNCEHAPEAPLTARLSGPLAAATGEMDLRLEIERGRPDATPMNVTVDLPAGVKLLSAPSEPIVDAVNARISVTVRVAVVQPPSDDLVVRVSARAARHGAIASASWSFGREVMRRAPLPRAEVMKGRSGAVLGQPVMLPRSAVSHNF